MKVLISVAAGVPAQHPQLGLEAGGRRDLPGGAQARLHRPVLPRPGLLHHDGKPLCYAVLHNQPGHGGLAERLLAGRRMEET